MILKNVKQTVADDPRIKTKKYEYDFNGNQTKTTQTVCAAPEPELLRENLWDEENRLRAIDLNAISPYLGGGTVEAFTQFLFIPTMLVAKE